jgi:hypothetical protein
VARSEARLSVEIWEDSDFLKLSPLAQRAYMFLLSQPDLAHDGVIPLRERRWARKSAGMDPATLTANLRELDDSRFLVIDWDTEEVLVRSFIRRDRVFKQPNVLRAAVDHIPLIESKAILRALIAETTRIRQENPSLTTEQDKVLTELEDALFKRVGPENVASPGNPSAKGSEKGSPIPSGNPTAKESRGTGSVTTVSTDSPFPMIPDSPDPRQTSLASLASSAPPRAKARSKRRIPDDFEVTPAMIAWAKEHTPLIGAAETLRFVDYWRGSGTTKADWEATWRNWMRKAQTDAERNGARASPRAGPKPSTTDERVNAALVLAAEFRTEAQKAIDP